jgi:hypothetical protein
MTPDRIYLSHTNKNSSTGTWHSLVDAVKTSDVAYVREDVIAELVTYIVYDHVATVVPSYLLSKALDSMSTKEILRLHREGLEANGEPECQTCALIAKWEKKE